MPAPIHIRPEFTYTNRYILVLVSIDRIAAILCLRYYTHIYIHIDIHIYIHISIPLCKIYHTFISSQMCMCVCECANRVSLHIKRFYLIIHVAQTQPTSPLHHTMLRAIAQHRSCVHAHTHAIVKIAPFVMNTLLCMPKIATHKHACMYLVLVYWLERWS